MWRRRYVFLHRRLQWNILLTRKNTDWKELIFHPKMLLAGEQGWVLKGVQVHECKDIILCLMFWFFFYCGYVLFVTSICTIHWFRTFFAYDIYIYIELLPYNATHLHATSRRLQLQENKSCMSVQSPAMLTELDAKIYPGIHYCNLFAIHGTPNRTH